MALVSPICRGRFSNAETEDEARFPPLQLVWAGPSFAGFFSLDWPQSPLTTSLAEGERRRALLLLLLLFPYRPKCSFFLLLLPEAASDAPKPYATTAMAPLSSLSRHKRRRHTQKTPLCTLTQLGAGGLSTGRRSQSQATEKREGPFFFFFFLPHTHAHHRLDAKGRRRSPFSVSSFSFSHDLSSYCCHTRKKKKEEGKQGVLLPPPATYANCV